MIQALDRWLRPPAASYRLPRRTGSRGIMLILVLWIVTILTIMAYSVIYQITLETRITSTRKKTLEAKNLARAGLARGFADLRNDLIFDFSEDGDETPPFDALGDVWADPEQGKVDIEMGNGTYTVEIQDVNRLLNLNNFNPSNRILLQKIIEQIGYEEEEAIVTAAAIIDYADVDEAPSTDSPTDNEAYTYGGLIAEAEGGIVRESEIQPVILPNEPYLSVDALLEVYGVTPELFFGPESEEAEFYAEELGYRWGDRFEMRSRRRSRFDGPPVGLRDFFTVQGNARTNINTAPRHVIQALLEAAGATDGDRLAESFIKDRPGGGRGRLDNDNALKSIQEAQASRTIGAYVGPMSSLHPLDVRSNFFKLTSTGTVGQVRQTLTVTVRRQLEDIRRDEDFETLDRAREREERLDSRRERWEDEDNENLIRIPTIRVVSWFDE